jgi:CobQ-like glutamine amidotransferase family enzyme
MDGLTRDACFRVSNASALRDIGTNVHINAFAQSETARTFLKFKEATTNTISEVPIKLSAAGKNAFGSGKNANATFITLIAIPIIASYLQGIAFAADESGLAFAISAPANPITVSAFL